MISTIVDHVHLISSFTEYLQKDANWTLHKSYVMGHIIKSGLSPWRNTWKQEMIANVR